MLDFTLDRIHAILYLRPIGSLRKEDFDNLSNAVDPWIDHAGGLKGIIVITADAPNWKDFAALSRHLRFVKNHHAKIAKVAIVTDSAFGNFADTVATPFVAAEVRHFKANEVAQARNWVGPSGPIMLQPSDGDSFDFGGLGVHWKIEGTESGGRCSVVHHPIAPRALAAPVHYHHREDEYSYVLKGTLGALLGEDVVTAGPGSWVSKPRHQWHTFWNAGDAPCEIIELISPGGFENYFREVAAAWGDLEKMVEINRRYELEMDFESIPRLCERFGLTFPQL